MKSLICTIFFFPINILLRECTSLVKPRLFLMYCITALVVLVTLIDTSFSQNNTSVLQDLSYHETKETIVFQMELDTGRDIQIIHYNDNAQVIIPQTISKLTFDQMVVEGSFVDSMKIRQSGADLIITLYFSYLIPSRDLFEMKSSQDKTEHTFILHKEYDYSYSLPLRGIESIRYHLIRRGTQAGPLVINVLELDLNDENINVQPVLASNNVIGLETLSDIVKRTGALCGINSSFFAGNGRPLGITMIDGIIITEPIMNRSAIGITKSNNVYIDNVDLKVYFFDGNNRFSINGINYSTEFETAIWIHDNTIKSFVHNLCFVPHKGYIVGARGSSNQILENLEVGQYVDIIWELTPDWYEKDIIHAVGGGPRLVKDGNVLITGEEENFRPDVLYGRAPRTAVGITSSNRLLLVIVNGRQSKLSIGMTLNELADFMIELGAVDALNMDGGGSSTMSLYGRPVNIPSGGVERRLGCAIIVGLKSEM